MTRDGSSTVFCGKAAKWMPRSKSNVAPCVAAELGSPAYARRRDLPNDVVAKYQSILDSYLLSRPFSTPLQGRGIQYDNPANGWNLPWFTSTPKEQEAGMPTAERVELAKQRDEAGLSAPHAASGYLYLVS